VSSRLPQKEDRAGRVGARPRPPGVDDIERLGDHATSGVPDQRSRFVGVLDPDVGVPDRYGRTDLRLGRDCGDIAAAQPGDE
jgi:hypothetical protein